jgi:hypothetical protein
VTSRRGVLIGMATAWAAGAARADAGDPIRLDPSLVDPYTQQTVTRGPRRPLPFTAIYERSGRRLTFVATMHDVARDGATFRAIERAFAQQPHALIAEGFPSSWGFDPRRIVDVVRRAQAEPQAVESFGRGAAGLARALALGRRIPFCGGEPDPATMDRALLAQGFGRNDIAGAKILQWIPQELIAGEFSSTKDPRFAAFLVRAAARTAADAASPPSYNRAAYEQWHRSQFGISVYDDPDFSRRLDPSRRGRAAEVSRAMTLFRDRHIYTHIMRVLGAYRRTLVVYGGGHLITQWRALWAALGRPRIV